jgi:hypothetical protein
MVFQVGNTNNQGPNLYVQCLYVVKELPVFTLSIGDLKKSLPFFWWKAIQNWLSNLPQPESPTTSQTPGYRSSPFSINIPPLRGFLSIHFGLPISPFQFKN